MKRLALVARAVGATSILGKLKQSSLIRDIFFKPIDKSTMEPMDSEVKKYLQELYEPDIKIAERLTGLSLRGRTNG